MVFPIPFAPSFALPDPSVFGVRSNLLSSGFVLTAAASLTCGGGIRLFCFAFIEAANPGDNHDTSRGLCPVALLMFTKSVSNCGLSTL